MLSGWRSYLDGSGFGVGPTPGTVDAGLPRAAGDAGTCPVPPDVALPGLPAGAAAGEIPVALGAGIVIVAVALSAFAVAVIVTLPGLIPLTLPCASIVAFAMSLDVHCTLAVRSSVLPSEKPPIARTATVPPTRTFDCGATTMSEVSVVAPIVNV
jgi:hypothetical protein